MRRVRAHRWLAAWLLAAGASGLALALLTPGQREAAAWLIAAHVTMGVLVLLSWWPTWTRHRVGRGAGTGLFALSGALAWWSGGGAVVSGILVWAWPGLWVARVHSGLGLLAAGASLVHVLLPLLDDSRPERPDHFPVT